METQNTRKIIRLLDQLTKDVGRIADALEEQKQEPPDEVKVNFRGPEISD